MESSKRIKSNLTTSTTIIDLPTDALLLILSRLDQKDLQSLSLVSKPFLDLSNRFIRKLAFKTLPNDRSFKKIFTRFPSVNQITLHTKRVVRPLKAISKSQLNLQTLKITNDPTYPEKHQMLILSGKLKIKSLAFGWISKVKAGQVVEFIRLFPLLEELYLGCYYEWDDASIESLAVMLPNLRKINLSDNYRLTDHALYALSDNCVKLEFIGIEGCYNFTPQGFCNFLLRCPKLRYLNLPCFATFPSSDLLLAETVSVCESVHHLSIDFSLVRDATLRIIAKLHASLMSFKMRLYDQQPKVDYTMIGLSAMLCAFKGLTRLDIYLPLPESDKFLDEKNEQTSEVPSMFDRHFHNIILPNIRNIVLSDRKLPFDGMHLPEDECLLRRHVSCSPCASANKKKLQCEAYLPSPTSRRLVHDSVSIILSMFEEELGHRFSSGGVLFLQSSSLLDVTNKLVLIFRILLVEN